MPMSHDAGKSAAADALRRDLDAGRGRDKVAAPDPSAAPLGTDDEAAGTPVTDAQAEIARRNETRGEGEAQGAPPAMTAAADPPDRPARRPGRRLGMLRPGNVPSQRSRRVSVIRRVGSALVAVLVVWLLLRLFGWF